MEKARRTAAGPTRRMRPGRLLLVSGLLALAGCAGPSGGVHDDDPMRGGRPIPANAPTTPGARGVPDGSAPTTGEVAKLPPIQGPTSPAALTAEAAGAEVDVRPVGNPGVKLQAPRAPDSTSRLTSAPAASSPVAASGVVPVSAVSVSPPVAGSYEQLQQMLLARGVAWQQLKTDVGKDEWTFACAIPHPELNNMERHYEARAVGAYGLAAIRAVIEDIDKDRSGQ